MPFRDYRFDKTTAEVILVVCKCINMIRTISESEFYGIECHPHESAKNNGRNVSVCTADSDWCVSACLPVFLRKWGCITDTQTGSVVCSSRALNYPAIIFGVVLLIAGAFVVKVTSRRSVFARA